MSSLSESGRKGGAWPKSLDPLIPFSELLIPELVSPGLSESDVGNGGGFTWPEAAVPSGPRIKNFISVDIGV